MIFIHKTSDADVAAARAILSDPTRAQAILAACPQYRIDNPGCNKVLDFDVSRIYPMLHTDTRRYLPLSQGFPFGFKRPLWHLVSFGLVQSL